tara:strand:+ start:1912 stop:2205 length:294 start_codon:yes stop_codon:yes gene_type:complete
MSITIKKEEIPENKIIEISSSPKILMVFDGENYHAFGGMCPHAQWPLNNGKVEKQNLTCVAHGYEFDIVSGNCLNNPGRNLKMYDVKIDGNDIIIEK